MKDQSKLRLNAQKAQKMAREESELRLHQCACNIETLHAMCADDSPIVCVRLCNVLSVVFTMTMTAIVVIASLVSSF